MLVSNCNRYSTKRLENVDQSRKSAKWSAIVVAVIVGGGKQDVENK